MEATLCRTALTDLFRQEQAVLEQLIQTLDGEWQALQAQDTEALAQAASDKVARLKRIEGMEQTLADIVTRAGYSHDRNGIEACIAWCDHEAAGELNHSWQRLLESLQQCQERNRHNGAAIETHRQHAQAALAVLRGQTDRPATYASSGMTNDKDMNTRTLAKA